ncbi:hypothetical protein [Microbacterium telephonicum]|uniref:Uncharacterized protein n=1 Tax=Microbacterium telephonicum TaxID=1714841 RepID=A0A498BXC1_9MICO|nr:hypothetical protein [Microbacterium telephonicum]RLK47609.1 hypothetical protein C7474_2201 [Microbacterium telephonicum]
MRALWQASIWARGAISPDEWKYRNLKRVWLPIYDLIAIFCGVQAVSNGSPLLNVLFSASLVDALGTAMAVVATVCLLGVAFPALWRFEIAGKVVLVGLISAYVTTILLLSESAGSNLFVVGMLTFGLPLAFFRLNLLGEEVKERRVIVA